jgi:hypothetical protein
MTPANTKTLWLRWVAANALGEMVGLGTTFAVIVLISSRLGNQQSAGVVLALFLVAVASGAIEATLVGLAQWWAMRPWFPSITCYTWWLATLAGALVAYVLGYLPSTLMSLGEQASETPVAEPPQWLVLLLAAGLGAIGGAVLSFAQWLAMRSHVKHAGWWVPANMVAWLAGMPIIFWGIDAAQKDLPPLAVALLLAGILFLTGMVVGTIHGLVLVKLAGPAQAGKKG